MSDFVTFTGTSSLRGELLDNDRDLANELFNKSAEEGLPDKYAKAMGYTPKPKPTNVRFKVKEFCPAKSTVDKELLEELLNSPKYQIMQWDKVWSPEGHAMIFVVYSDNLDYKEPTKENE